MNTTTKKRQALPPYYSYMGIMPVCGGVQVSYLYTGRWYRVVNACSRTGTADSVELVQSKDVPVKFVRDARR